MLYQLQCNVACNILFGSDIEEVNGFSDLATEMH